MKSRKQIRQKLEQLYRDVRSKRKNKKISLQLDQEFQQVKTKDLNDLNNVEMFSTFLRGGKAFAAEQKIRELKTRIAKLFSQKLKMSPRKIIEMSTSNMNIRSSKKYVFSPEEVEKRSLESERFRTVYNMQRVEKTHKLNLRQDRCNKKSMTENKKNLEKTSTLEKKYTSWQKE